MKKERNIRKGKGMLKLEKPTIYDVEKAARVYPRRVSKRTGNIRRLCQHD
jgi:hypothetical protein